ncbi:MAG TPA: ROK family protein, partial [Desulfosporosinus sp.]|nr:ROK family protein [Desulfosporosinus sp.]
MMINNTQVFEHLTEEARDIFSMLQKNGPLTKNSITLSTKLKLTTLNRIMQPLEEARLVRQYQIGESTGGRRPVLYDVNANKYYLVGIDISRTYTQVILANLKLEVIEKLRFPMDAACTPENTLRIISDWLDSILKKLKINPQKLLGIGLGTVGPLDRKKGVMINPVNFEASGWVNLPIKTMLEETLGIPVMVDNGANAAVLAEMLYGKGKNLKNVVYFNFGIGIRTGVISSGTIIRTINDTEDAFAHMVINIDGEACSCGNYGCIECYSSVFAITGKYLSELKRGEPSKIPKSLNEINYMDICLAAENEDELSVKILSESAAILGTGLANFINLWNPDLVILSGPLIKHSTLFYKVCTE